MSSPQPLTAPSLDALPGVRHAFFTAQGGVSTGIYASLNVGLGSNDNPDAVHENRRRCADWFGTPLGRLATGFQVHSATALLAEPGDAARRRHGDALVANRAGLICGILTADCAPVLFADVEADVVGAAHAGWRGAIDGVLASTVAQMTALGARPDCTVAVVGPCIAQASYEVGPEFRDRFVQTDPAFDRFFVAAETSGKSRFDLPAFVLHQLAAVGVTDASWVGRDTCAEAGVFFSNRRAVLRGEPDYGRQLSAIMLS